MRAQDQLQHTDLTQVPSLLQKELVASFKGVHTIYYEISMHLQSFSQTEN